MKQDDVVLIREGALEYWITEFEGERFGAKWSTTRETWGGELTKVSGKGGSGAGEKCVLAKEERATCMSSRRILKVGGVRFVCCIGKSPGRYQTR